LGEELTKRKALEMSDDKLETTAPTTNNVQLLFFFEARQA
jgi:hypothetical protein